MVGDNFLLIAKLIDSNATHYIAKYIHAHARKSTTNQQEVK